MTRDGTSDESGMYARLCGGALGSGKFVPTAASVMYPFGDTP